MWGALKRFKVTPVVNLSPSQRNTRLILWLKKSYIIFSQFSLWSLLVFLTRLRFLFQSWWCLSFSLSSRLLFTGSALQAKQRKVWSLPELMEVLVLERSSLEEMMWRRITFLSRSCMLSPTTRTLLQESKQNKGRNHNRKRWWCILLLAENDEDVCRHWRSRGSEWLWHLLSDSILNVMMFLMSKGQIHGRDKQKFVSFPHTRE